MLRTRLVVFALVACKGGSKPPAAGSGSAAVIPPPSDTAAVVADGAATIDTAAEPDAAHAGALKLRTGGVGPIAIGMAIDKDQLVKLLPGYDVSVEEESFEGETSEIFNVKHGDESLMIVKPNEGKVSVIQIGSPKIESDTVRIGMPYEAVLAAAGPLDCERPPEDDPFYDSYVCNSKKLTLVLAFAIPEDAKDPPAPGADISDARAKKLMAKLPLATIFVQERVGP